LIKASLFKEFDIGPPIDLSLKYHGIAQIFSSLAFLDPRAYYVDENEFNVRLKEIFSTILKNLEVDMTFDHT